MKAITVRDHDAGIGGLSLAEIPYPHAVQNDVIVQVHSAGFTTGAKRLVSTPTAISTARSVSFGLGSLSMPSQ